mmetsp:Transcript_4627/g.8181  ORF Transcript_4627/g.8181 Transcript_4627/m.8181 type:complete len:595 (-) Transcript_4627:228-2012(-)
MANPQLLDEEAHLTGNSLEPTHPQQRLPKVLMLMGGLLLAACSASAGFAAHAYLQKPVRGAHSHAHLADWKDVQSLLEVFQKRYGERSNEVFKSTKLVDIDASDPSNIKFEMNKEKFPDAPPMRDLQEYMAPDVKMSDLNYAMCGIDAFQLTITTGQIVNNYKAIADACEAPYPQNGFQQDLCANMVMLNIAIWGYWIIYIEDMVSACADAFDIHAGCAIDVTGLFTNGALAGAAGAGMKLNCKPPGGYEDDKEKKIIQQIGGDYTAFKKIKDELKALQHKSKAAVAFGAGYRRLEALEVPDFSKVAPEQVMQIGHAFLDNITVYMQTTKARRSLVQEMSKLQDEKATERLGDFYKNVTEDLHHWGERARRLAETATLPADPLMESEMGHPNNEVSSIQKKMGFANIAESVKDDKDIQAKGKEALKKVMPNRGLVRDPADIQQDLDDLKTNAERSDNDKNWQRSACAFDLGKATGRLAQFGTLVTMSTIDCSAENFGKKGEQGRTKCAVDVTGIIASAGIAASMITISTVNCPAALATTTLNTERFCAASIIDLVVAITYISTSIASIAGTCGSLDKYMGVPGTPFHEGNIGRR